MALQNIDTQLHTSSSTKKSAQSSEKIATNPPAPAETKEPPSLAPLQAHKKQYNAAILQAHHEVSLSVKNDPLALIYKAAIDSINKELETDLGENSIERGYEQGLDVSPEATADRILSFSTGLFSLYQQQHPNVSEQEQAEKFVDIISGGVDTGFSEAREILDGLGILEGDIAENIDKTYTLVQEGLIAFREKYEIQSSDEA